MAMQETEETYNNNKDDLDITNRFIMTLKNYIDTGLLLENRMLQLRRQLSEVLEHKLVLFSNSRSAHELLIQNEINLGNYDRAAKAAFDMREKWPNNETSWLNSLHVSMASGNAGEKAVIEEEMASVTINWSKAGREEAEFLCGI